MGKLSEHQSSSTTKLLFIGDSGAGKSGALASLAKAGYNLRILDFDNGLDILANLLRDNPEAMERVVFETITDKFKNANGRPIPVKAEAWGRAVKLLSHWKVEGEDGYDLGPIVEWGPQDILVIDSLTFMSNSALRFILSLNARLGQPPQLQDWGEAMRLIEDLCGMLYSDSVKCNVVITSHISYLGEEGSLQRGYPSTLGQKLPPKIGRYFNAILLAKTTGAGAATKREIHTVSQGTIELKNPNPHKVPAKLPLDTGLADYFKAVRQV